MICYKCGGTGQYLGNGMMLTDCDACDKDKPAKPKEIDRKSKSYKKAIKEIMDINPKITYEEAVKMFDKAYENK